MKQVAEYLPCMSSGVVDLLTGLLYNGTEYSSCAVHVYNYECSHNYNIIQINTGNGGRA